MWNNLIVLTRADGRRAAFAPEHIRSVIEKQDDDGKEIIEVAVLIGEPIVVIGNFDQIVDSINTARREN